MFLKKKVGLIIVSLLSVQCFFAQQHGIIKKRFPVKSLSYEDGLLDNNISSIVTDGNGFTWVSTFTGLQRYNGYMLQTINPVVGQDTFHINYAVYLFELNDGNILISSKDGVLKYDAHTNQFTRFIDLATKQLFHFSIVPLKETEEGLWCMQQDDGIVLYNTYGKRIKNFSFFSKGDINEILKTDDILFNPIITYNDRFIYINSNRNIVLYIDTKNETTGIINQPGTTLLSISAWHDKLFLVKKDELIVMDNNGTGNTKVIKMESAENITGVSLQRYNNNMYLSRNGSLYVVDTAGNIEYELTDQNKKPFVQNGNIQKVYLDKFNRLWILSNNDIKRVENEELFFQHFTYSGNPSNFIRALYFDTSKNILLAAGYDGLIEAFDTLANPLWQQPVTTKSSEYILNIEKLTDDEYLATAFYAEPFIFNSKTKKTYPLSPASNAVRLSQANYPCNLQRINDSTLFIATNSTVYNCVFNKTKIISATPLVNFIKDNKLNCFLYDSHKKLWVGTANGLLYMVDNGTVKNVVIPGNYAVRSMAENNLHQVLIGTEKGLFIYDNSGAFIKSYAVASGLRNDCIYAIAIDNNNNTCFVSTNLGLSSIDEQGTIHNYAKTMGLQENEFNTNAVLKLKNGKIFFGGVNGVTAFYPSMLSLVKDKPLIHITRFTVNNTSYTSFPGIWNGNEIHLNYNENRLQFDIAAIGMLNVNEYVYQYRLKNLDTTWQTTYEPININYTLQPGNYILEIKCHSLLSSNVEFIKNYTIIISPPFWQTWWFRTILLLGLVAVVYFFIYRYNKNKYLKKIRLLETQQQIQTERERISRELHDNVGSQISLIISNIDWTIDSVEKMTKSEEAQRLASINVTAKNVMTNLRENIWALNKEKITIEEFADKLKAYVQNVMEAKPELVFTSTESIKNNITFSPTETLHLFRICQEATNNVMKHADASSIKILIQSDTAGNFSIIIEDNGKGFDESVKKGHGLENMMHRAKEVGIQLDMQSQKNKGTIVRIYK